MRLSHFPLTHERRSSVRECPAGPGCFISPRPPGPTVGRQQFTVAPIMWELGGAYYGALYILSLHYNSSPRENLVFAFYQIFVFMHFSIHHASIFTQHVYKYCSFFFYFTYLLVAF